MRKISELKPYENNPRLNDETVAGLAESIRRFGFQQPIVVDSNDTIIVGHTRMKAAERLGLEEVPTISASNLTEEEVRAYRILDNKLAERSSWDFGKLSEELAALSGFDFGPFEVDFAALEEPQKKPASIKLADRFLVPPFSILDARQGYWQDRKRAWLSLGIESELGRGQDGSACPGGSPLPGVRGPRKDYKPGQSA